MCLECGYYNGRQVMDLKAKKEARQARLQMKHAARNTAITDTTPDTPAVEESK